VTKRIRPAGHPTPWQRIIEAAKDGRGIRLSWEECCRLHMDGAIETRASLDDDDEEDKLHGVHEEDRG